MQTMVSERGVIWRRNAQSGTQRRSIVRWLSVICLGILFFIIGNSSRVFAEDELYLTGIVKNINPATAVVYVEVSSESCRGMRIFHVDDPGNLEKYVNMTISFYIDSSMCGDNKLHAILVPWGITTWGKMK